MKKLFIACLIIAGSLAAMDLQISDDADHIVKIEKENVFASHALSKLDLYYDGSDFKICQNKRIYTIERHELDPILRKINASNIQQFLKVGSIRVSQLRDGRFALKSHVKGIGGGPGTASALYWVSKSICWGGVGAAAAGGGAVVAATVISTGGTAGLAMGVAINAGTSVAVASTGAGSVAAGAIAAAIGTSAGATTTAAATTAAVASAGGAAGLVGAIEAISLAAFAFGMALPLP